MRLLGTLLLTLAIVGGLLAWTLTAGPVTLGPVRVDVVCVHDTAWCHLTQVARRG